MITKSWCLTVAMAVMVLGLTEGLAGEEVSPAVRQAMLVEDAFAEVVERAKPAVVVITNKQFEPAQQEIPPEFRYFFGIPQRPDLGQRMDRPNKPRPAGKGSGVIVRADGYLVTNFHVIKDHEFLEVKTVDGTVYDNEKDSDAVTIVGVDEETDLAVLRIGKGKKDFPALRFTDSDVLRVGQWVIAIGAPFNLDYSVTIGCVSQKGRNDMGMSTYDNYIQTDASINPGNSGGPLLNIRGEIVGINQFIVTGGGSSGSIGIGFAIASNLAKQVVDALVAEGEVARPFLGISMQELTEGLQAQFEAEYGVIVSGLVPDEAAEKAGIMAGDVIQKIGGKTVRSMYDLRMAVTSYRPGDTIKVTLLRKGKERVYEVVANRRGNDGGSAAPESGLSSRERGDLGKLGLRLSEKDGVVVVEDIMPNGAVALANVNNDMKIMPGDILHEVNRQPIASIADLATAVKSSDKKNVMFWIERMNPNQANSYRFFVAIPMTDNDKK